MKKPTLDVDFNEMLEPNLVLLSADDIKIDSSGKTVSLHEGMEVSIYMDDIGDDGKVDDLVANGVVERNPSAVSWGRHVKWCCRINDDGIRNESAL